MEKLKELVIQGEELETVESVKKLLEEGKDPEEILNLALIPSMDKVGMLFQEGELFIPELLMASRSMQKGVDLLKPLLVQSGVKSIGKIIIGTVKGDMHDIGKNILGMIFEGAGFEVIDLGVDVSAEKFIDAIKKHNPIAIGLSALLTSTMINMKSILNAINEAGLREKVKVLIGGAPVTQAYADEIGADFYGPDPTLAKNYILRNLTR